MSFPTPDLLEDWLRLLSAVVGTNRSRSGYPHIGKWSETALHLLGRELPALSSSKGATNPVFFYCLCTEKGKEKTYA